MHPDENYMADYTRGWRAELKRRRRAVLLKTLRDIVVDALIGFAVAGGGMAVVYLALGLWHH